jgi:thiol-disulfide isomerase/thioredoxin
VFASWCEHCRTELDVIAKLRAQHPALRVLGANYKGHEEYDHRGSASAVRAYVAANAPWLRVVPIDDAVFAVLGRPPTVPTMFVYDHAGALIGTFDRRERTMPDAAELDALLRRLGA